MKVHVIGWVQVIVSFLIALTTFQGGNMGIEIFASWVLYTTGMVLVM